MYIKTYYAHDYLLVDNRDYNCVHIFHIMSYEIFKSKHKLMSLSGIEIYEDTNGAHNHP